MRYQLVRGSSPLWVIPKPAARAGFLVRGRRMGRLSPWLKVIIRLTATISRFLCGITPSLSLSCSNSPPNYNCPLISPFAYILKIMRTIGIKSPSLWDTLKILIKNAWSWISVMWPSVCLFQHTEVLINYLRRIHITTNLCSDSNSRDIITYIPIY